MEESITNQSSIPQAEFLKYSTLAKENSPVNFDLILSPETIVAQVPPV